MDERKFLDKIRKLKDSGTKIGLTEMKDINKSAENLINEWEDNGISEVTSLIKEETIDLDAKTDVQYLDPDEQRDEENSFKDTVSKLVKFTKMKVYKQNVEWSGTLVRENIDWVFSLDDSIGCYIDTTEFIQLKDETLETLKKLRGYYEVWSDEWSGRLTGTPTEDEEMTDEFDTGDEEGGFDTGAEEGGFDFGGEEPGF